MVTRHKVAYCGCPWYGFISSLLHLGILSRGQSRSSQDHLVNLPQSPNIQSFFHNLDREESLSRVLAVAH